MKSFLRQLMNNVGKYNYTFPVFVLNLDHGGRNKLKKKSLDEQTQ
jgi:hypothetical protein